MKIKSSLRSLAGASYLPIWWMRVLVPAARPRTGRSCVYRRAWQVTRGVLLTTVVCFALLPVSHAQFQAARSARSTWGARGTAPEMGAGSLQVISEGGEPAGIPRILPLKHTDVKAEVSGFVAEVEVTQVFENPSEKPIEALYVFPLPENAAVNEMTLTVADRVIRGQIKKRDEAREIYERAKAEGKTAALLDEERPNIFTQSVANIPPGREIKVTLSYIQDLPYDHSVYRFVFPMVVGPRFIPGRKTGRTGTGWAHDTNRVPDASRITPPVLRPGERSGHDISLIVKLDAGIEVKKIRSPSHDISVKRLGKSKAEVALDPADSIPNKDFILTYEPAGKAVEAAILSHKTGKEGYLTLMIQPQADFPLSKITPKELVFAIDVSGSMSGFPVETAKETALRCLDGMNPDDTFQILSFASGNRLHFERPLRNTPENIARARAALNRLHGGGSTQMLEAIRKALEFPKDPERLRIILFMTDGYIGNEKEILAFIKEHLNNCRIFPLGVGSSPNRYLLEEMAVMGRGTVQYVRQYEKPAKLEKVIERFYDRIAKPCLTDLSVDWKGLDILDPTPTLMPDLFAGQPIFIHARYREPGKAAIVLRGKLMGKPWKMRLDVKLPKKEAAHKAMGPLWARARITDLTRAMYGKTNGELKEEITQLALKHQLVTPYTSFVAVDESRSVAKGEKPMVVPVAVELPEGTRYEGFFGSAGTRHASTLRVAPGTSGPPVRRDGPARKSARMIRYASSASPPGASFNGSSYSKGGGLGKFSGAALSAVGALNGLMAPEAMRLKTASPAGAAGLKRDKEKIAEKPKSRAESRVAKLAGEILRKPSRRLARQLISLQDASGAFTEPDGRRPALCDHALAVLALAKAKSLFGTDVENALRMGWQYLKAKSPRGLGCQAAVTRALKSSPHWSWSVVRRELKGLAPILKSF